MALRKINKQSEAIAIGGDKGQHKSCEGFLLGAKYGVAAKGKNKGSNLYQFQDEKGNRFDVWGNASINNTLCESGKVDPSLAHKFIVIKFMRMGTAKKGQSAPRICDVFVDDDKKFKVK
jgi:hypothetical protein